MRYTSVVLTRNEQHNIRGVIESVRPVSDAILVVDDFSEDDTPQIAADLGAVVFQRPLENNWAQQRDFGMGMVETPWALMIDADERLDTLALSSLANFRPPTNARVGKINRTNYYRNRAWRYGWHINHDPQRRVLRSDVRYRPDRPVHEIPDVDLEEMVLLAGNIEHFTVSSMGQLFAKYRRYGQIQGESGQVQRPLWQAVRHLGGRLVIQRAFLDGAPGLMGVAAELYGDFVTATARSRARRQDKAS